MKEGDTVWQEVGGAGMSREFYFMDVIKQWVLANPKKGGNWARIFSVTCWWQWHWRNKMFFEEGFIFLFTQVIFWKLRIL